jgi:hypothetical protein
MPPLRRIVSVSMVAAATTGLIVPVAIAPPAGAATCNAPEANVDPPASPAIVPSPSPVGQLPIGRRPRGAIEQAPLPKLGPLISALIQAGGAQSSAPVQQQAAVVPPNPPDAADQVAPDAGQPSPDAAAAQVPSAADPADAIGGSTTSLVEFVTGPNSPNKTLQRFGISGTDLGIPWDNGDPANPQVLMAFGDTFGYCRLHGQQWRYNVMLRSEERDLSTGSPCRPARSATSTPAHRFSSRIFPNESFPASSWSPTRRE